MQKKLIFLSFGDIFTFPNACAIQTNLGIKELLEKTLLEIMGYCQNGFYETSNVFAEKKIKNDTVRPLVF